jgi:hypothetical protein
MYFHCWCRRVVVMKITHRAAALQNVHGAVAGRCKHLFRLCQYGTMFKLLSAFRFVIGESYSSTLVAALLHDLAFKCTGALYEYSLVLYIIVYTISVLWTIDRTSSVP